MNDRPPSLAAVWWTIPAGGFILLLFAAMLLGGPEETPQGLTSYDAGPHGYRAAYLLLDELDYPASRSRRRSEGTVRFVFRPDPKAADVAALDAWVRGGGLLVLADVQPEFAQAFGASGGGAGEPKDPLVPAAVDGIPGVATVLAASSGAPTSPPGTQTWGRIAGRPLATIHRRDRGEVWVVHPARLFSNDALREADNAVALCRLADAALERRPGRLTFDEYVHGLRNRPSAVELLLRPPMLWTTLAGLALTAVLLWHHAPRFGEARPERPARRRSKEEFLDAVADLLGRKGDLRDAFETVRRDVLRRVEQALGLPGGTPVDRLLDEAERRRGQALPTFRRLLAPGGGYAPTSGAAFVEALNELETAYDEFRRRRPAR